MKAMILAAGRGERLRPITDTVPKPLIEINGKTMLERSLINLRQAGVFEVIVNVWHLAEKIEKFLKDNHNFGMDIEISKEEKLLDTGGGLKKAAYFFSDGKPFFLYNSDILTDFDLNLLKNAHKEKKLLATLAVKKRPASRKFIFNEKKFLTGWVNEKTKEKIIVKEGKTQIPMAFCGIHIVSPEIFDLFPKEDVFSMTDFYLNCAKIGKDISFYEYETGLWHDIGDEKKLAAARKSFDFI